MNIGHNFSASNMADIYEIMNKIFKKKKISAGYPLWFRGHESEKYFLLPSLMRKETENVINVKETYDTINLQDDYRLQTFKARVLHLLESVPLNRIEWQALYQHHFGTTRLMDWTESLWIALAFAIEAFLDPQQRIDLETRRSNATPVIWVLDPIALNRQVLQYFLDNIKTWRGDENIFQNLSLTQKEKTKLIDNIKLYMNKIDPYYKINSNNECSIESAAIMNLGMLDEYRQHHMGEIKGILLSGEWNPFFYLCLRYFSDALPIVIKKQNDDVMPPLAVLHQYQSERIRAQKGTFTVFPNYFMNKDTIKSSKQLHNDFRRMEEQPRVKDCIYKIRLLNPREIAKEFIMLGGRQTDLYPENDFYARTIEANNFFC